MSFTLATKEIGFVKGSLYGPPGTGKTTVMAMLLIYLSKVYHNSAPVAWLASEKGVDFVLDFFKAEGVPLLVSRSRSFVDLRSATRDAREAGCCAVGVDSITHFWQELFSAGMEESGPRLQKIMRIKEEWNPFSQDFQDSPLHFLVTGRLGFNWEEAEVQDEKTGEIVKEVSRGRSKIKAEGDFGHEPDLEIEMSAVEDPDFLRWEKVKGKNRRTFKSQMIHVATLKKSRVWALNGKAFSWKDQPGYKLGYYATVAEAFKPHFDSINIGGSHNVMAPGESSSILFTPGSEQSYTEQQIKRTVALEKWLTTMNMIAPGQSAMEKKQRLIIGVTISGTKSQTEFERQPLAEIEHQVKVIEALEDRMRLEPPADEKALRNLIGMAEKDVADPEHRQTTMLEAMLGKSVANLKHGPQAVVSVMDKPQVAEAF